MLSRWELGFNPSLEFRQVSSRREGGRKGVEAVREGGEYSERCGLEQGEEENEHLMGLMKMKTIWWSN